MASVSIEINAAKIAQLIWTELDVETRTSGLDFLNDSFLKAIVSMHLSVVVSLILLAVAR